MRQLTLIANKINKLADLNIFENTRKRKVCEARSLFCFIAFKYFDLNYSEIAKYLIKKGKSSAHCSVLFSIRNYEMYQQYNPNLEIWLRECVGSPENLDKEKLLKLVFHKVNQLQEREIRLLSDIVDSFYLTTKEVENEEHENVI